MARAAIDEYLYLLDAAFGGVEKTCVTEVGKFACRAPVVPPAMSAELTTAAMVFSAVFTDASVHLILCALSALYLAAPNVRR